MDIYMDCCFDEVFKNLERDSLGERFKRRELVSYFSTVIEGCSKGAECNTEFACQRFVAAALRYHESYKSSNGQVCLMGKYHNVLYIAMKIAFDWSLQDNGTVARLLDEIYDCEKTFERLFMGAIFGTSAPHFIAGWKSDFLDKEENIHALVYFLDHATNAGLEYCVGKAVCRFIDIPLESCGTAPPVRVVVQMGAAEMLMILLRFGAKIECTTSTNPVETILDRLNESNRKYPYELITCLKLLMRVLPSLKLPIDYKNCGIFEQPWDYNYQRKMFLERYPHVLEDRLIPASRCGLKPPELKHLCRCIVRENLWKNFQLPFGIRKLPIPDVLHRYIDICTD